MNQHTLGDRTEVDRWKVRDLVDALSANPNGEIKLTIPPFQRNIVWTTEKREAFIDSIKLGFPIGSLLLYSIGQANGKRHYSLVDGLQRCYTLKNYNENQFKYFKDADIPDSIVTMARSSLSIAASDDVIRSQILRWLKDRKSFDEAEGYSAFALFRYLQDTFSLSVGLPDQLHQKLAQFLNQRKTTGDVSEGQLPVLIFQGSQAKLPEIFNRINSKGTPLNKYQIYAATWSDARILY